MKTAVFSEVLRGVRYAFFPRRCAFCGRVIDPCDTVCGQCADEVLRVQTPICYCCGCGKDRCVCRKRHSRFVTAVASPFYYAGNVRETIRRMKFRREPEIAQVIGDEMASFARQVYDGVSFDLVTFVPMTQKEQARRGYNQSELLARRTADKLSLPCEAALCKLYETKRQRTLRQRERSGNVLGVFDVSLPQTVRGKRILLCDDLRTTGSTLAECAKMLCLYGAKEVFCLTAAVGLPKERKTDDEDP